MFSKASLYASERATRRERQRLPLLFLLLLLLGMWQTADVAAQVFVEATVDKNQLTTDDILLVTVQVNAQPDVAPTLPPLTAFRVVGTSSASQISIVNGATSASFAYRFQLRPTDVGVFTIDPIDVIIDNQRYSTNSLTVEVAEGNNPLPDEQQQIVPPTELNGQDFYVESSVDNPSPYLGEQILYIFSFFQALELGRTPSYDGPDFVGFWDQQENQQTSTLSEIAGRAYRITSLSTPLFPTTGGDKLIEPAEFTLPDGRTLLTEQVAVQVKPLPEPAPENFTGAVGEFVANAAVDKTVVAVGEAVTWRVALGGIGNIDTLPEPIWPEIEGWRMFEEQSAVSTEFANGIIQGQRQYDRILIPSAVGEYVLPGLDYGYFDPKTEQYVTVSTEPVTFVVTEGDGSEVVEESADNTAALELLNDIADLRETPRSLRSPFGIIQNPIFWSLWALPLLLIGGERMAQWRRERKATRELQAQKRNALKLSQQAIAEARADNLALADQQAERILTSYLSDKYDESFVGLSQASRSQQLRNHAVRESLIRWTNRLYDSAEGLRFGYKGGKPGALLTEVEQLISRFERGGEDFE